MAAGTADQLLTEQDVELSAPANTAPSGEAVASLLQQLGGLSARELNQLKRKRRLEEKAGGGRGLAPTVRPVARATASAAVPPAGPPGSVPTALIEPPVGFFGDAYKVTLSKRE